MTEATTPEYDGGNGFYTTPRDCVCGRRHLSRDLYWSHRIDHEVNAALEVAPASPVPFVSLSIIHEETGPDSYVVYVNGERQSQHETRWSAIDALLVALARARREGAEWVR